MALAESELAWLEVVYRAHKDMVFGTCMQFASGDRAWALDRMHDVFVLLARDHHQLDDKDKPGPWLYRASVNQCLMALRSRKRWSRIEAMWRSTAEVLSPSADRVARARHDVAKLEKALERLSAKQRAVFVLVELEQVSQKEVCEVLKLSKGQISKLHSQAIDALRGQEWNVDHG